MGPGVNRICHFAEIASRSGGFVKERKRIVHTPTRHLRPGNFAPSKSPPKPSTASESAKNHLKNTFFNIILWGAVLVPSFQFRWYGWLRFFCLSLECSDLVWHFWYVISYLAFSQVITTQCKVHCDSCSDNVGHYINQAACWLFIRFVCFFNLPTYSASKFPLCFPQQFEVSTSAPATFRLVMATPTVPWFIGVRVSGPWDVFDCFDLLCNSCSQEKNIYHRFALIHRFIEKSWKLHHFTHTLNRVAKTWSQVYWTKRGKKWIGWRRKASAQEFLDAAESYHSETQRCSKGATIPILPRFLFFWAFVLAVLSNHMTMTWELVDAFSSEQKNWALIFVFFCAQRFAHARHHQVIQSQSDVGEARAICWKPSLFWGPQGLHWHHVPCRWFEILP